MKKCICPDWDENVIHIENICAKSESVALFLMGLTSFKFCPFCGRELINSHIDTIVKYNGTVV